jgi:hypothetical protein
MPFMVPGPGSISQPENGRNRLAPVVAPQPASKVDLQITLIGVPGRVDARQNAGLTENSIEPVEQHQSCDMDFVIARGEVRFSLYALLFAKDSQKRAASQRRLSGRDQVIA